VTPTPQEPPTGEPGEDGPDHFGDDADGLPRGWIDPQDRLWRHPSELARDPAQALLAPPVEDHRSRIMLVVGAVAALAAVAWTVILLSPPSAPGPQTLRSGNTSDSPLTTLAGDTHPIPAVADPAGQAMVQLRAITTHGDVAMVGVAVAEGGLVATLADGLSGLRAIDMVGPGGRLMRASVVAMDSSSDLALVNVPDDLPVAPFSDDAAVSPGSTDMTLSMLDPNVTTVALACTPGSVTSVGTAIATGPAGGMPSITSTASRVTAESGDLLLNAKGAVIGILYGDALSAPTFLPTQLVLGVADDLRSSGKVAHGWLGVNGPDTPGVDGAPVAAVVAGSPAAALLQPGEVITAIGSLPVRSMAELRARLYVLAPRTTVALSVRDGSVTRVIDVTLSASP
jgi:S1-C subfamily serine protease